LGGGGGSGATSAPASSGFEGSTGGGGFLAPQAINSASAPAATETKINRELDFMTPTSEHGGA
jgi:hypothetical protein